MRCWQFVGAYCVIQVDAGLRPQTRRGGTPPRGTRLQRVQHQRITAAVDRQPTTAQRLDALHPGRSPVDSSTIVTLSMFSNICTNSSGLISTPLVAGLLSIMIEMPIAIANAEKILKDFAFGQFLVIHRQGHHRIGAGAFRVLRAPSRLRGRRRRLPPRRVWACVTRHEKRALSPYSATHGQPAARSASRMRAITTSGR